jgi:hypothetical protein
MRDESTYTGHQGHSETPWAEGWKKEGQKGSAK